MSINWLPCSFWPMPVSVLLEPHLPPAHLQWLRRDAVQHPADLGKHRIANHHHNRITSLGRRNKQDCGEEE
jgi:hypothetical protein